jgi:hypothetical protein
MLGVGTAHPSWLAQPVLLVLLLGLVGSAVVGLLLLVVPQRAFALNAALSRWISTAEHFARWEKPYSWERFFYRHHRVLGGLITLGAAYVLLRWAFDFNRNGFLHVIDRHWVTNNLDWLISAAEWIVVAIHVFVLGIGLVVLFRPSELKTLERSANRWLAPGHGHKLDTVYESVDRGVAVYPRVAGLVVLLASFWCIARLLPVLELVLGR